MALDMGCKALGKAYCIWIGRIRPYGLRCRVDSDYLHGSGCYRNEHMCYMVCHMTAGIRRVWIRQFGRQSWYCSPYKFWAQTCPQSSDVPQNAEHA